VISFSPPPAELFLTCVAPPARVAIAHHHPSESQPRPLRRGR
jgi:hypothetical protein